MIKLYFFLLALTSLFIVSECYAKKVHPKMKKEFIDEHIKNLNSEDPKKRKLAASLLGGIGVDSKKAIPRLIKMLNDEDPGVRKSVVYAIGRMKEYGYPHASKLVPLLKDKDKMVRHTVVRALGSIGNENHIPFLQEIINNSKEMGLTISEAKKSIDKIIKRVTKKISDNKK